MERIEFQGLEIAFQQAGDGPLVVLCHGGLSDSREWRRQIEALAPDFTVVTWDAPGCGSSADPPEESFRMPDYARCLAAVIESTGRVPAHVGGLSFGGTVALALYAIRPDLVKSLILISAYAGWAGSLPSDVVAARLEAALAESDDPPTEIAQRWLPTLLTDKAPAEMTEELVEIMSELHPVGFRTMVRSMAETDLRRVLPTVAVPTLLLYGDSDVRSPLAVAKELAAEIPEKTFVVIPGVGHQLNVETADRCNVALQQFLYENG